MDISIGACEARALISVNSAIFDAAYSHQYHMQGACKIADRPATDRSDPPKRSSPGRTAAGF